MFAHNEPALRSIHAHLIAVESIGPVRSAAHVDDEARDGRRPVNAHIHLRRGVIQTALLPDNLPETVCVKLQHTVLHKPRVVVRRKTAYRRKCGLLKTLTEYALVIQSAVYLMIHILSSGTVYQFGNRAFNTGRVHRDDGLCRQLQSGCKRQQSKNNILHKAVRFLILL